MTIFDIYHREYSNPYEKNKRVISFLKDNPDCINSSFQIFNGDMVESELTILNMAIKDYNVELVYFLIYKCHVDINRETLFEGQYFNNNFLYALFLPDQQCLHIMDILFCNDIKIPLNIFTLPIIKDFSVKKFNLSSSAMELVLFSGKEQNTIINICRKMIEKNIFPTLSLYGMFSLIKYYDKDPDSVFGQSLLLLHSHYPFFSTFGADNPIIFTEVNKDSQRLLIKSKNFSSRKLIHYIFFNYYEEEYNEDYSITSLLTQIYNLLGLSDSEYISYLNNEKEHYMYKDIYNEVISIIVDKEQNIFNNILQGDITNKKKRI